MTTSASRRWKYYVDDVTAGKSRAITDQGNIKLQEAMFSMCNDASQDHMSLKVSKCATVQFHVGRSTPPPSNITSNGQLVSWCLLWTASICSVSQFRAPCSGTCMLTTSLTRQTANATSWPSYGVLGYTPEICFASHLCQADS